jgi:mono/diheme cytochrome c family protein
VSPAAIKPGSGMQLYRQYCGKCHALAAALSAGFGPTTKEDGGPSFNDLRVSYGFSIEAITEPTGGHEALGRKMTPKQIVTVARWIAKVTAHHPLPALPTDG